MSKEKKGSSGSKVRNTERPNLKAWKSPAKIRRAQERLGAKNLELHQFVMDSIVRNDKGTAISLNKRTKQLREEMVSKLGCTPSQANDAIRIVRLKEHLRRPKRRGTYRHPAAKTAPMIGKPVEA